MPRSFEGRFFEVDFLRGCAIIMMFTYHTLFDLVFFGNLKINLFSPFWQGYATLIASMFIGLVGLSLTLSLAREKKTKNRPSFSKYLRRGLLILFYGFLITLVTYLAVPDFYVRFGVLHCIGLSIILAYPLIERPWISLALGITALVVGRLLNQQSFPFSFLLWLGFKPHYFQTFDYFPLFPWFGVVLFGIVAGNFLYPSGKRAFALREDPPSFVRGVAFLGRHSLTLYLLHQPVILTLLFALRLIRFPL